MDGVRQFFLFYGYSSTFIHILDYFTIAVPNSIKVWKHSPKTKDGKKTNHVSDDYHDGIQLNSLYFWTFFHNQFFRLRLWSIRDLAQGPFGGVESSIWGKSCNSS